MKTPNTKNQTPDKLQPPSSREVPNSKLQAVLSNHRQVLECVRVEPLSAAANASETRGAAVRSKAVSSLRFATALQDAGAVIKRFPSAWWLDIGAALVFGVWFLVFLQLY
jgi:hypothetical protein